MGFWHVAHPCELTAVLTLCGSPNVSTCFWHVTAVISCRGRVHPDSWFALLRLFPLPPPLSSSFLHFFPPGRHFALWGIWPFTSNCTDLFYSSCHYFFHSFICFVDFLVFFNLKFFKWKWIFHIQYILITIGPPTSSPPIQFPAFFLFRMRGWVGWEVNNEETKKYMRNIQEKQKKTHKTVNIQVKGQ